MVAYAYAAQFPTEVSKLVLMDAFLPGVAGWEPVYNNPGLWHFRFNGPTPRSPREGPRVRTYFDYFWNDFAADKTHSLPEADRQRSRRLTRGRDACTRDGSILFRSKSRAGFSLSFLTPN